MAAIDSVRQPFAPTPPYGAPEPPPSPAFAAYDGPARVPLTGRPHAVRFPAACAACGAPARDTLRVEKLFRRTSHEHPSTYHFAAVDVPFCADCRAHHAAALPPVDPAVLRRLRCQFVGRVLPYVIPLAVLGYMITVALLPLAAREARDGAWQADGTPNWGLLLALAVLALFVALLLGFLTAVSRARFNLTTGTWTAPDATYVRRERLFFGRNAVIAGPPTPTLAAVDFTDDRAALFEPERHTFTFRDAAYADQVRSLNADRVWSGRSPRARWARRSRHALFAAVLLVGGLVLLDDWLGGALVRAVREFLPW